MIRRFFCARRGHPFINMTRLKPDNSYLWEYNCRCGERVEVWRYFGQVRRVS